MSRLRARHLLLAVLVSAITFTPATIRAATSDPARPSVDAGPLELPPLWQGEATPSHHGLRASPSLAPLSTASLPEDAAWEGFTKPGAAGGSFFIGEWHGKLVLGGCYAAGHTATNGIAIWNGTDFEGVPPPGSVQLMTIWNDRIVVAVYDASSHWPILAFNGTSWDTLGVPNNYPFCLSTFGGKLVAGGRFTAMSGIPANRVAAYDGTAWTAFGSGFTGASDEVDQLRAHAGALIAAGSILGGKKIGAWNNVAGTWDVLGQGLSGTINALTSDGVSLYVTGGGLASAGTPLGGIARWDGVGWNALPGAAGGGGFDATMWNGRLVTNGPQPPAGQLSQWDGVALTGVPGDSLAFAPVVGGTITRLGTWGTRLVVTGTFRGNGSVLMPSVAIFDGVQWTTAAIPWETSMLSPSFVVGLGTWNGKLLVGTGNPVVAQRDHYELISSGILTFDGSHWAPLSATRVGAPTEYFTTWNGDLVVAGYLLSVAGTSIHGIARWNGTTWSGVGSNPPFDIVGIQVIQNDLYVINDDDGSVAHLNGTTWEPLGGLGGSPFSLGTDGNVLFAGGEFTTAGGAPANGIATWDGTSWHALGAGLQGGPVDAIAAWNGLIVAGGRFTQSGGQPLAGAAFWDGNTWQQMGSNVVNLIYMENEGGDLLATGRFRLPGGEVVTTLAKWTGSDWHLLGSGGSSYSFESYNGYMYLAGLGLVNGHASHGLSRAPLSALLDAPKPRPVGTRVALSVMSNPARGHARFSFALPAAGRARLAVYDLGGRMLATLADGPFAAGTFERAWTAPAAAGVYFIRLDTPAGHASQRFVFLGP